MTAKEEAPERLEPLQGQKDFFTCACEDKVTKLLSKRQKKVFNLLLTGKRSVTDITIMLGYSDPRSYVKELRFKGINVQDEWVQKDDIRFKRYWIEPEPPHSNIPGVKTAGEVLQENFKELFERRYQYD